MFRFDKSKGDRDDVEDANADDDDSKNANDRGGGGGGPWGGFGNNNNGNSNNNNDNNNGNPPPWSNLKGRLARAFLNFLDEHGDYRSGLEEAAARAAAAEANSIWAKDRLRKREMLKNKGRAVKRRRRSRMNVSGGGGGEMMEDEWEEYYEDDDGEEVGGGLELPPSALLLVEGDARSGPPPSLLPEDPYDQMRYYYAALKSRLSSDAKQSCERFKMSIRNYLHDEIHHPHRVPLVSGTMMLAAMVLHLLRIRTMRMKRDVRAHSVLGKKFVPIEYVDMGGGDNSKSKPSPSTSTPGEGGGEGKGPSAALKALRSNVEVHVAKLRRHVDAVLLRYSSDGNAALSKLRDKSSKAEMAALASMRPYMRSRYERLLRLERALDVLVSSGVLVMVIVSGISLALSLNSLYRDDDNGEWEGEDIAVDVAEEHPPLDGRIYSLDGPVDNDGYPFFGLGSSDEEGYASCLADATIECDPYSYFLDLTANATAGGTGDDVGAMMTTTTSPLRSRIHDALITWLHLRPSLAAYLTSLHTTTISYLASLFVFLLLVISHYVGHRIGMATMRNDPMRHFVLTSVDKNVKADGTVEAKRGETEAQRKRRERMMQSERLKAQMAQLAMEAKLRVEERRVRLEGAAAIEREKEEEGKRVEEEGRKVEVECDEMVKNHGRQYMMIKAGVPEGAIQNSLIAEGYEDESERKDIISKLVAIKTARAEAARLAEEEDARRVEEDRRKEVMKEEETERIAKERLRVMKSQRSTGSAPGGNGVVTTTATTTVVGKGSLARSHSLPVTNDGGAELRKKLSGRMAHASSLSMSTLPTPKLSIPSSASEVEGDSVVTSSSKSTIASSNTDPSVARANMLGQIIAVLLSS